MSEKSNGPAARTRSRKISGLNPKEDLSAESATSDSVINTKKEKNNTKTTQRSVSAFFYPISEVGEVSLRDTELIKASKKRSKSGKIYRSIVQFGASFNASSLNCNEHTTRECERNMQDESQINTQTTKSPKTMQTTTIATPPIVTTVCAASTTNTQTTTSVSQVISTSTSQIAQQLPPHFKRDLLYKKPDQLTERQLQNDPSKPTQQIENASMAVPADPLLTLLTSMNEKLGTIQDDMQILKVSKTTMEGQIETLIYDQEDVQEEVNTQRKDLNSNSDRVDILMNVLAGYEQKMTNLQQRCLNLEAKGMRSELIIFGLASEEGKTCIDIVTNFFRKELGIENVPNILYAY